MYITITVKSDDNRADIKIDDRQIIRDGMKILRENGVINCSDSDYFHSYIQKKVISSYITFNDAGILSGDVLTAINIQAVNI